MIAPSDAAVAARSFPRRWRELFARAEQHDVLATSGAEALVDRATDALLRTVDALPVIHAAAPGGAGLARLDAVADRLASAIDGIPGDSWTTPLIEVLTQGIDEAASVLRQAERAVEDST